MTNAPLLDIQDLVLEFGSARAVDGVSFSIQPGETLCLVGESGSGKSVTALSIARLLPTPPASYPSGRILLEGVDVLRASKSALRAMRGSIVSYIFQDPSVSLNPVFRVGSQIKESLKLHRPADATDAEAARLLQWVGIPAPESRLRNYPHEMSGGMQQRVMIAMALAAQPKLLIADEPTTALDVTIQAQILDLLKELKQRLGMAMLLITHNLGIVGQIADRVAVMYGGKILEMAESGALLRRPLHPYTQALMRSAPQLGASHERLTSIPGNVPALGAMPGGCPFHPRCSKARPDCAQAVPQLLEVEPGRWVRCPYWNS
ncbi:MAG TPA: ABC transporter ATP-binding protein [Verrucomicrobiae bacterium]|nr:ABC transporter ATP-binding protein [Verrucomicrobiae bacterium]